MLGQKLGFFCKNWRHNNFLRKFSDLYILTPLFLWIFDIISIEDFLSTIYLFSDGIQAENGLTKQGMDYSIT